MPTQQAQRTTALVIDLVFKVAVTAGLGTAGWLFTRIESHEARIMGLEARAEANAERFEHINAAIEDMNHKLDQVLGWTKTR